ncbi:hypothetical protein BGZ80_009004 [Entomortierella chlamydospora]|uniref:Adhesin domain-containing protein n=1 Tax=Entomortierella chlamydospora TaxID=101097 RepID=A0A9P6N4T8_9FUNG|nr:hypothetical protein BGZ80_009004 [Entomortierella chlamydospora]
MVVVGALAHSQFTRWNRLSAINCATPYGSDPTVSTTYWFDPLKYPNLHVRLDDTLFGKVLVSEAESPFDKNVKVNIKVSASMPSILEGIAPRIRLPEYQSQLAEIWLDTTSLTREARENIRERLCVLTVIEIVYPLPANYTGSNSASLEQLYPASLNIETYNTQITVDVRSQAFSNKLAISNMGGIGNIHIISAASTKSTVLTLARGKISGRLSTQQAVYANVQGVGKVSLAIDANDRIVLPSSDKLQALDMSVSTDGSIHMQLFGEVIVCEAEDLQIRNVKVNIQTNASTLSVLGGVSPRIRFTDD